MAEKAKMNKQMKKDWKTDIVDKIYNTFSSESADEYNRKAGEGIKNRIDSNKAKDFVKGFTK